MRAAMFVLVVGLGFPSVGAQAGDPSKGWEFTGQTQAVAAVDVQARVTGHLTRAAVKDGDAVKKGDLLVEIDPQVYRLDLEVAKARLNVTEAKSKVAKIKYANTQRLFERKYVSSDEVALKAAEQEETEATLKIAKLEVERAELTLSWTRVTAPFDGRVSRIRATEGGLVTADQTRILTVVSTDKLHVFFNVPDVTLLQLRRDGLADPGKLAVAVGFAGEKGYPHAAKLGLIEPKVDSKTGTVRFRATVPNPKGFLSPGMSARVRLTPAPK